MSPPPVDRVGALLVLASGVAFGTNAVFAKLSYRADVNVATFLAVRFCIAAAVLWLIARPSVTRRQLAPGLLMGLAYCGQAGFYFTALSFQDASVTAVFQAITPALVAIAAVVIGREAARARVFVSVGVAALGMVAVALGGGSVGKVTTLGLVLALSSAVWYSVYLLVGDRVVRTVEPLVLATLVATGGGVGFAVGAVALGQLQFDFQPIGWIWLIASAAISTVIAVTAVMAGMKRIGPSLTGILATFEPVATTAFAFVIFDERLTAWQAAGAALVFGAVVAVQLPGRRAATVPDR